jgi:hypothetical protein
VKRIALGADGAIVKQAMRRSRGRRRRSESPLRGLGNARGRRVKIPRLAQ